MRSDPRHTHVRHGSCWPHRRPTRLSPPTWRHWDVIPHPATTLARRSTLATALTAVLALVGSVLLGVVAALPAQAHEGHGHVLHLHRGAAGPWHDEAIAHGTPKMQTALEANGMTVTVVQKTAGGSERSSPTRASRSSTRSSRSRSTATRGRLPRRPPWRSWKKAGGGIAAIHNATDMRGNYPWWDTMIGALMPGHSAAGTPPPGVVRNEDITHPSTKHFQGTDNVSRWTAQRRVVQLQPQRPRHRPRAADDGRVHLLRRHQGYDHPITWCKPYEGGRFWGTALGHFPSHYDEPEFMASSSSVA